MIGILLGVALLAFVGWLYAVEWIRKWRIDGELDEILETETVEVWAWPRTPALVELDRAAGLNVAAGALRPAFFAERAFTAAPATPPVRLVAGEAGWAAQELELAAELAGQHARTAEETGAILRAAADRVPGELDAAYRMIETVRGLTLVREP